MKNKLKISIKNKKELKKNEINKCKLKYLNKNFIKNKSYLNFRINKFILKYKSYKERKICIITGRCKSNKKFFKLNRILIRDYIFKNKLTGIRKSLY